MIETVPNFKQFCLRWEMDKDISMSDYKTAGSSAIGIVHASCYGMEISSLMWAFGENGRGDIQTEI